MPNPPSQADIERSEMIKFITDDLPAWLERDPINYWRHSKGLEQVHLATMPDDILTEIFNQTLSERLKHANPSKP